MIHLPNDNNLGDTMPGFRTVHLQLYGVPQQVGWFSTVDQLVAEALANAGWAVDSVVVSGSGVESTRFGTYLDVFVEVNNIYSQADIEQGIVRDLSGTFEVTHLSVISGGNTGSNGGGYTNSGGGIYDAGQLATVTVHTSDNTGASGLPSVPQTTGGVGVGGTQFLNNLATGLGISTPVVLLGGAVLLAVMLKK
jgi:hypothetical protein